MCIRDRTLCGLGDDTEGVAWCVDAAVFLGEVIFPVGVEVAVADHGAEFQDGFGCWESPAGAGDIHAIFDQVAAGALDHAGRDRPAVREQLSRVVDEKVKDQAATSSSVVVVSSSVTLMPSLNFPPSRTSPTSSWPLNRRQRSWAASSSL